MNGLYFLYLQKVYPYLWFNKNTNIYAREVMEIIFPYIVIYLKLYFIYLYVFEIKKYDYILLQLSNWELCHKNIKKFKLTDN